jgi:hypothetical protein
MDATPRKAERKSPTLEELFQAWELAGESPRDCEPHRAGLLLLMARASLLAGGLSFVCLLPALAGIPLGLLTGAWARRDLDLICAGRMDQDGYRETERARSDGRAGAILGPLGLLFWPTWLVLLFPGVLLSPPLDPVGP